MTDGLYLDTGHGIQSVRARKRRSTPDELMESYDREVEAIQKKQKRHNTRLTVLERKIRELRTLA